MMGDYATLKQCVLIHIISILEKYSTVSIFTPIMSDYVISILISLPCISNSTVCIENISFDYWRSHIVFERKPHRWLQCKFMLRSNVILFYLLLYNTKSWAMKWFESLSFSKQSPNTYKQYLQTFRWFLPIIK